MKHYFQLHYKMFDRQTANFGFNVFFRIIFSLAIFVALSIFLFSKTEFAPFIFILISQILISKLSEIERNDFLKTTFHKKEYIQVRIIENILCSTPFILFLLYEFKPLHAIGLILLSISISFLRLKNGFNFTLPTPFSKKPFEFSVGFRNTILILLALYAITIIAIYVHNFNLGVFALIATIYTCMTYYSNTEDEFFVWIFNQNSKQFIISKIKRAILSSFILTVPLTISISLFFPTLKNNSTGIFTYQSLIPFGILLLGIVNIINAVICKYSSFPSKISFANNFILGFAFLFPPLLLFTIPYFYSLSIKNLKETLNDNT